jgi:F0F1-type ATP synthase delta subunit
MTRIGQNIVHAAEQLLQATYNVDRSLLEENILEAVRAIGKSSVMHKTELLLAYKQLALQALSEQQAVAVSALRLSEGDQHDIEVAIKKKHPAVRSVLWELDPNLIGGITVLVADQWYDFSIRQQLTTIREQLSV